MAAPTDSYKQFHYALRPSKQVERKIMIEILLRLSRAGFWIDEYTYMGFGSVYYVDFVMFHKYLSIEKMVCIEWGKIAKRMRFNKPFDFIKLRLGPFAKFVPTIKRNEQMLLWLDYDRPVDLEILQDLDGSLSRLASTSVFLVTVDARPRLPVDVFDAEGKAAAEVEEETFRTYRQWFGEYSDIPITKELVSRKHVAELFYEVLIERIGRSLSRRNPPLKFIQLFNFYYRDGAPMLTIGGMIGEQEEEGALGRAGIFQHQFVRRRREHLEISVPPLTTRETHWLDHRIRANLLSRTLEFELDQVHLDNYCKFYKEYPTYLEALL